MLTECAQNTAGVYLQVRTNSWLLQHVGDRRDDGGDSAGQSRGGRDQESPAGLRQGQEGEGDEWVSCPHHHHDHLWPLAKCGLDCLVEGYANLARAVVL